MSDKRSLLPKADRTPWTPLHAKLHRTIRSRHLFERNQRLLVAVSGGQDSLCLIKLLLDLQPKWGWNLSIVHCDHRWRPDSQANANHVENLAKNWDLSFYLRTAHEPLKSEAAARNWRYQALSTIACENQFHCIITGHTASDRAETLLYNLIRGTGADGLQALTWQRLLDNGIVLVRPLLEMTRTQTGQFCQDFQLPVWEDSTNQDLKFARNRIRQQLLPYLQENFNLQVESALAQTAEILQAEVEYLEQAAHRLREEASGEMGRWGDEPDEGVGEDGEDVEVFSPPTFPLRLNRRVLQKAPLALQRRVMRQVLQEILQSAPSFEQIEKLIALITAPNRSQTDPFPGGAIRSASSLRLIAQVQGDWIYLKQFRVKMSD